jgi:GTP cyclohydrolase II
MKLLTNKPPKLVGLSGYGLEIVSTVPLEVPAAGSPAPDTPAGGRVIPLR